jgi:DNA-binding NarL/FixJ family response regulator
MDAQVVAARCFDDLTHPNPSIVNASQLKLPKGADVALQDWPLQEESVFGLVQRKQLTDHVFRPREIMDEMTFARQRLYHPIEPFTKVVDAICITTTMNTGLWAMIAFLRCGQNPYFTDEHFHAAERYQPAVRNALIHNHRNPVRSTDSLAGKTVAMPANTANHNQFSPSDLLSKLTRTERRVLEMLRSNATEKNIADNMHRSPHTIHVHVKNIYRKLGIGSRKQLQEIFGNA